MIPTWLLCVLGTALCWGAYGPTIHQGATGLGSPWKAFLMVGGAYFVLGVIIPAILVARSDSVDFKFVGEGISRGTAFAVVGGAFGAIGALLVISAMRTGGSPLVVMPLVFGLAPVVNVIVSWILHPPKTAPSPLLWVGMVILAAGAAMVLAFKPK